MQDTCSSKCKHSQLTVGKSNERTETEKKTALFFQKLSTFEFRKKLMVLKLIGFVEQFMMDRSLLN